MEDSHSLKSIHLLPEPIASLIAAGEVVERPAAVVKELVENSLDAGAKTIEIVCHQAGFKELRVTDDGWGIPPRDAPVALERHATSKIVTAEDLQHIQTYGFRGEALAAISAVAKLELLTRVKHHSEGFLVISEGAKILQSRQAGCAPGTSVTVRELFFNTPARRRFMKSSATEQAHIITAVELSSLANLNVSFKLSCDEREVLFCPSGQSLEDRLRTLFPKTTPNTLLGVDFEAGGVEVKGVVSKAADHQGSRNFMRWFVNQRPVDHRGISHAVLQVYQPLLPKNRYPFSYLFLKLSADLVDVNVHPTKREVRFRDESAIHRIILNAIRKPLESSNPSPWLPPSLSLRPNPNYKNSYDQAHLPISPAWSANRVEESVTIYHQHALRPLADQIFLYPKSDLNSISILGMVGKSYIAGQDEHGFFLLDQHAAHERLIYEELKNQKTKISKQILMIPIQFEIEPAKYELLFEIKALLDEIGIEISPFGKNSLLINTQPDFFMGDLRSALIEITDEIDEKPFSIEEIKEKTYRALSCKAAVKSGEKLDEKMIISLLDKLNNLNIIPTCPHGRPFIFRLSWDELDKLFKRDYS
jgi:DNA mismatch repair protein MutL